MSSNMLCLKLAVAFISLGLHVPLTSFLFFLPTFIQSMGFPALTSQLLTIPPYVAAFISILVSDCKSICLDGIFISITIVYRSPLTQRTGRCREEFMCLYCAALQHSATCLYLFHPYGQSTLEPC